MQSNSRPRPARMQAYSGTPIYMQPSAYQEPCRPRPVQGWQQQQLVQRPGFVHPTPMQTVNPLHLLLCALLIFTASYRSLLTTGHLFRDPTPARIVHRQFNGRKKSSCIPRFRLRPAYIPPTMTFTTDAGLNTIQGRCNTSRLLLRPDCTCQTPLLR
jgi:hypothetical protein